jgi:hypothetical protein
MNTLTRERPARLGATRSPSPQQEQALDLRWSAFRQKANLAEKIALARYFVDHHFLINSSPERPRTRRSAMRRTRVASIIVNGGTTPNVVVGEILHEVKEQTRSEPFFLTWYTPGLLVPRTLRDF